MPPIPNISSPVINDIAALLPQIHVCQEVFQPSENENIPIAVPVDGSSASKYTLQTFIIWLRGASVIQQKFLLDLTDHTLKKLSRVISLFLMFVQVC